jgi:hypothetical protein
MKVSAMKLVHFSTVLSGSLWYGFETHQDQSPNMRFTNIATMHLLKLKGIRAHVNKTKLQNCEYFQQNWIFRCESEGFSVPNLTDFVEYSRSWKSNSRSARNSTTFVETKVHLLKRASHLTQS